MTPVETTCAAFARYTIITLGGKPVASFNASSTHAAVKNQIIERESKLKIDSSLGFSILSIELPIIRNPNRKDKCSYNRIVWNCGLK